MRKRTAFTIVELLVVIAIIGILVGLTLPAVQYARESARQTQCKSRLRQIGLGLQLYHDSLKTFPSGYIYSGPSTNPNVPVPGIPVTRRFDAPPPNLTIPPSHPGWSWAALLLPFIEQQNLANQINWGSPVEAAFNADIRSQPLTIYQCPSDTQRGTFQVLDENNGTLGPAATNSYCAVFGAFGLINTHPHVGNGLFQRNSDHALEGVLDGAGQTLAVGERSAMFAKAPWAGVMSGGTCRTTPGAPVYTSVTEKAPAMVLARIGNRTLNSPFSEPYDFFSSHRQVVHFLFADGAVHPLSTTIKIEVLRALATRADRELVSPSDF